ncbi:unnamed protein product [Hermetia illucens]|uniref:C2H2-type domain-containing protein n=2 Tax=Hermetia illucens TaxID=343691 RepID=A0A7R8YSD9_HERIL|nr:unnamed protein product [Hermetia illucens]
MSADIDFVGLSNFALKTEYASEEEFQDDSSDTQETEHTSLDPLNTDQEANCGRILVSINRKITLVCGACNGRFDYMESFGNHLEKVRCDYMLRKNGCVVNEDLEAGINGTQGDAPSTGSTATDVNAPSPIKNTDATKYNIRASKTTVAKGIQSTTREHHLKSSLKSKIIATPEPKHDVKRNLCLTCNRRMESRESLMRHQRYHRYLFRKQQKRNLERNRQEDSLNDVVIKEEIVAERYEIQEPEFPTSAYDEVCATTSDEVDTSEFRSPRLEKIPCEAAGPPIPSEPGEQTIMSEADKHPIRNDPKEQPIPSAPKEGATPSEPRTPEISYNENETRLVESLSPKELDNDSNIVDTQKSIKRGKVEKIVFTLKPEYDEEKNFCITCNRQLATLASLRRHKREHIVKIEHWKMANGSAPIVCSEKCKLDGKGDAALDSSESLLHQKRIRSATIRKYLDKISLPETVFTCDLCEQQLQSSFGLKKHAVIRHGDEIPKSLQNDPTYLKCRFCHEEFEKPTQRYLHEGTHLGQPSPYQCPCCPKTFTKESARKVHMASHIENYAFSCPKCPKKCKTRDNLYHHIKSVHVKIKPFSCKYCGKAFSTSTHLASHMIVHTKNMPYQCDICLTGFRKMSYLRTHKRRHDNQPDYECDQCGKQFVTKDQLRDHLATHADMSDESEALAAEENKAHEKRAVSTEPGKATSFNTNTEEAPSDAGPSKLQSKATDTTCEQNNQECTPQEGAELESNCSASLSKTNEDQITLESDSDTDESSKCANKQKSKIKTKGERLVFAVKPEFDDEKNFCITCNRQLPSRETYKRHKRWHISKLHRWNIESDLKAGKEPRKIVYSDNPSFDEERKFCITCDRGMDPTESFVEHKKEHTKEIRKKLGIINTLEARLPCEFCNRKFQKNFSLRNHLVLCHGDRIPKSLQDDPSYLKCRYCHQQFEKPTERHIHEGLHSSEMAPYRCSECPKIFTTSAARKFHKRVHTDERPFNCPHCPLTFKVDEYLYRHVQNVHAGVKPFQCEYCPRSFYSKLERASHSITHTNESPHQCDECGTRYRRLQTLQLHKKRHANQLDHKCEECGKLFLSKGQLKLHRIAHSDVYPFRCGECGKQFQRRKTLISHEKLHRDEKGYSCTICGKQFAQASGLYSHKKTHGDKL